MPFITWKVHIDFDNDGSFATAGDEVTSYVMDMSFKNGMQNPYQHTSDEAELQFRLKNHDARFSPENAAGTYYGKLKPQRPVRIQAIYAGATQTMYVGWVETFDPAPFRTGERVCVVRAIGAKQFLQDTEVYLPLMQNTTADAVVKAILNQVIMPPTEGTAAWRLGQVGYSELGQKTYLQDETTYFGVETGKSTFAYVGDSWENGISANDALERVMRAERGKFFYTRTGTATFYNREHYQIDTANDGTVNNTMAGGDYAYGDEFYPIVRVNCSPRLISSGTVALWTLDKPVDVPAGGTVTIRARYTDSSDAQVAGTAVQTPVLTATHSGITLRTFTAAARSAEAEILNTGAQGSVTAMSIFGIKMTSFNQVVVEQVNGTAAAQNGRRVLSINADLVDNVAEANYIASWELMNRGTARGMFRNIDMLEKGSTANASAMYNWTMGTRIRVQETQTGHDTSYFIVGEEWRVDMALKQSAVKFTLEPVPAVSGWLIEVAGRGELDQTTYIGF